MNHKKAIIIAAVIASLMITGCSSSGKEDTSSVGIKVKEGTLKSQESETDSQEDVREDIYVPDIRINFNEAGSGYGGSYNLSQFSITKKDMSKGSYSSDEEVCDYDIVDLKLEKFTKDLGLSLDNNYSTIISTEKFYFTALGYSGRVNPRSRDSIFSTEIEFDGEVTDEYDASKFYNYNIRAVKLSRSFIEENDYQIEFLNGNLYFGMSKDDVIKEFGEGFQGEGEDSNHVYYRVSDASMVLEFSSNALDTVYLIRN